MLLILQRRAGLTFLWLASLASAQEITGVIQEPGVTPSVAGLAVGEATVKIEKIPPGNHPEMATVTTDGSGVFQFKVAEFGTYRVSADKEGYTWRGGSPFDSGPSRSAEVTLDREHPSSELHFVMVREAKLTGRLIDEATGRPISGLTISAMAAFYYQGRRRAESRGTAETGNEGQFAVTVPPGDYVVANGPRNYGPFEMLKRFSEDDRKVVDREYEWGFWPGGPDLASALPVVVGSGQLVDMGTLKLRKTASYRVRVSLPEDNCSPGETVLISEFTFFSFNKSFEDLGSVPCGGKLLARNFQPGTYWLVWTTERPDGKPGNSGFSRFEVHNQNLDLAIHEERGATVEGRIVATDGAAKPPLDQIQVYFGNPVIGSTLKGTTDPGKPDADGNFRIKDVEPGFWQVRVSELRVGFYVKEVRYNRVAAPDGLISVSGPGALEVLVDDKPAALRGVVTNDNDPVSQPEIVLVKWPPNRENLFFSVSGTAGDADGRFQFPGLTPGEYRILAVSREARARLQEPGVLERLLGRAEKLLLEPAAVQDLRLKLADAR